MRTCSIGDLHGRPAWKDVIRRKDEFDKIVFIADYCDSFTLSNDEILHNLLEIIFFKKENPDQVELLTGNHDGSYFYFPKFFCQGFRPDAVHGIQALFQENRHLFKVAYQHKNYLWTHAGVTNKWMAEFKDLAIERGLWDDSLPIADILNMANETSLQEKLFQKSGRRQAYAETDLAGGIMWADRSETKEDSLNGYHQICGHTPIDRNTILEFGNGSSITYIDSLHGKNGSFYELEIED